MCNLRRRFFSALTLFATVPALSAFCQNDLLQRLGAPPTNPTMPIPNGFVNLQNGNVHLEFDLHTYAQRSGPPATLKLIYDSQFYSPQGYGIPNGSTSPFWVPDHNFTTAGWTVITSPTGGYVTDQGQSSEEECSGVPPIYQQSNYSGFAFIDNTGTAHTFTNLVDVNNRNANCGGGTQTWQDQSSDGYKITVTVLADGEGAYSQVWDKFGTLLYDNRPGAGPTPIDTNGNYFTYPQIGFETIDQLGRTIGFPTGPYQSMTVAGTAVQTQSYPICTAFQQAGIQEYCSGSTLPQGSVAANIQVPTTITLPDGRSYSFEYDTGTTPGHYGQMTKMILPTGGEVDLSYSLMTPGGLWQPNADDRLTSLALNGANWQFDYEPNPYDKSQTTTTTVTAPPDVHGVRNQTVYSFSGIEPYVDPQTMSIKAYSGSTGGTPVSETDYVFGVGLVTQATTTLDGTVVSKQQFDYDLTTGLVTSKREYDSSNNLLRETTASYNSFAKPLQITVYGPGGAGSTPIAQTLYGYDTTALTPITGTQNHDDQDYSASNTSRGNLTTVQEMVAPGNYVTVATNYYNTLGQLIRSDDANENPTTYDYTDQWNPNAPSCVSTPTYAYPTTVTNALNQSTTTQYNSCDGSVAHTIDPNGAQTSYGYDGNQRITSTSYADAGGFTVDYGGIAVPQIVTKTTLTGEPSGNHIEKTTYDGLGRKLHLLDASSNTDWTYDNLGRLSTVSNPYNTTGDPGYGITTFDYDAAGRTRSQTDSDGISVQTWNYSGNVTSFTDESGNQWQRTTDALGRLSKMVEPGGISTTYSYDPLDNLTCVDQWGTAGVGTSCASSEFRSFNYDSLSRLLSSRNPETGTLGYSYTLNGAACAGDPSLPCSKTDARAFTTSFTYDALNRLTKKSYSDGVTPTSLFVYDVSNITFGSQHFTTSNVIGRLSVICVDIPGACQSMTSYSYDPMGRVTQALTATPSYPSTGAVYRVSATYDLNGDATSLTYPDGRVVTQGWNNAGQLQSITYASWNGQSIGYPYISAAAYWANGALRALLYGNSMASGYHINNRLQIDETSHLQLSNNARYDEKLYCFGVATSPIDSISPPCDQIKSGNNGNVLQIKDVVNSSNLQSFSYDSLNRLTSATSPLYSQQYWLDSFGNMSMMSGGSPIQTFDSANHISNLPCAAAITPYDAAGNRVCDSGPNGAYWQYTWDAENRLSNISLLGGYTPFATYLYDANGDRLSKQGSDGSSTEYINFNGLQLAERNVDGSWSDYIFANGQRIAKSNTSASPTNGPASTTFYHFGRLGSTEVLTNGNGALVMASEYLPFGQELSSGTDSNHFKFIGKERDTESGNDYFGARYYSSTAGRFMSPDDGSDQDASDPQSWNLYAYVRNNPLTNIDPDGHGCQTTTFTEHNIDGTTSTSTQTDFSTCDIFVNLFKGVTNSVHHAANALSNAAQSVSHFISTNQTLCQVGMTAIGVGGGGLVGGEGGAALGGAIGATGGTFVVPGVGTLAGGGGGAAIGGTIGSVGGGIAGGAAGYAASNAVCSSSGSNGGAATARSGLGNVGGGSTTAENALKQGEKWLGPGYKEIAPGVYRSADGLRQFRMTTSDLTDASQGVHVHFESIGPDGRVIVENSHVGITNP